MYFDMEAVCLHLCMLKGNRDIHSSELGISNWEEKMDEIPKREESTNWSP